MSIEDKEKWNKKYQNTPSLLEKRDASKKLIDISKKVTGNKALDVASGPGRNSIFLAQNGFDVLALDISEVAIQNLKEKAFENITCELADFDDYVFPQNSFDLIIMSNFLDRNIIPKLSNALTKNGILFIETYMEDEENEKPPSNPAFLLKKGELKTLFDDNFEVIEYDEFFNESYELYRMKKQSIAVKKL